MLMRQGWSPEFLAAANIETVQTEYEVLHLMRQCANHFSFSHFLVTRFPANAQQRFAERLMVSNWPADLVRKYDATQSCLCRATVRFSRPPTGKTPKPARQSRLPKATAFPRQRRSFCTQRRRTLI